MVAKQVKVSGKVQGVFYRKSAKEKGDTLKIMGWIKNNNNGNVIAVVQGNEVSVNEFIEWCRNGPSNAIVTEVEIMDIDINELFSKFEIIH